MVELLDPKDVSTPALISKLNELIEAHNQLLENMPGGLRRRMERTRERENVPPPEPEE